MGKILVSFLFYGPRVSGSVHERSKKEPDQCGPHANSITSISSGLKCWERHDYDTFLLIEQVDLLFTSPFATLPLLCRCELLTLSLTKSPSQEMGCFQESYLTSPLIKKIPDTRNFPNKQSRTWGERNQPYPKRVWMIYPSGLWLM